MNVLIIYCHPSNNSFTYNVLESFVKGLECSDNINYKILDLYAEKFDPVMDLNLYSRESSRQPELPIPEEILKYQNQINWSDIIVFIYPVWWSDCPAILKGWFDRVYSLGYAYTYETGNHRLSKMEGKKGLVICTAGHTVEHLEETGIKQAMEKIMLLDRLSGVGFVSARMVILGGMVSLDNNIKDKNLEEAYFIGKNLISELEEALK